MPTIPSPSHTVKLSSDVWTNIPAAVPPSGDGRSMDRWDIVCLCKLTHRGKPGSCCLCRAGPQMLLTARLGSCLYGSKKKSYCSLCCCFPNLPFSFSLSSLPPIPPVRCTPLRQFETQTFPSGSPFFWHSTAWLDPGLAVSASANE